MSASSRRPSKSGWFGTCSRTATTVPARAARSGRIAAWPVSCVGGSSRKRPPAMIRSASSGWRISAGAITRSQCCQVTPCQTCEVSLITDMVPPGTSAVAATSQWKAASGALR